MAKSRQRTLRSRYLVGVDLGTTHTVVAYADTRTRSGSRDVQLLPLEQLVAPGEVAPRPLLPSLRYHPAADELAPADRQLPWPEIPLDDPEQTLPPGGIVGELARQLGTKTPGRLVASAKSWLSHAQVDRSAAILPWGAPEGVAKVSPLAASAGYLAHVRAAWDQRFPDHPLAGQDLVLTLPASFDEVARGLTVEAARLAGLTRISLLEEPQAACYDWLNRQGEGGALADALADTRLLLVCDVGGGTTDLSLIQVRPGEDARLPELVRIGVGDHLMLGGDNMDLALARLAEQRLGGQRQTKLGGAELAQLLQQCRGAKERLLAAGASERASVTLLGGGSRLIGGARTVELTRAEVESLVLDGFLPVVGPDDRPHSRRGAIVEFGLPFVTDPAVTRHLAAFLQRFHAAAAEALASSPAEPAVPDTVLLNGGVFQAAPLAERLLSVLAGWRGQPLRRLDNDPFAAVARGAVAYGMARRGKGLKIGGGSARSYFLLLDERKNTTSDAQPRAVCLLPRGSEEGREVALKNRSFALRLGQPVRFHLSASSAAKRYRPGDLVELDDDAEQLPPVATVLGDQESGEVPVQLVTGLTEVGTLALRCEDRDRPERRWRLEFQLRGGSAGRLADAGDRVHPRFDPAAELIRSFYGGRSRTVDPKAIKTLRTDLEKLLGKRDTWDVALTRELFGVLLEGHNRRRRSADHERLWFNLAGFCLRPGFGYPLDDWRVDQLWPLFAQGLQHVKEPQLWAEWWTLWRRVAGGLESDRQRVLLDDIAPYLAPPAKNVRIKGVRKQGYDDMLRLAASLEQLPPERKTEVGNELLARLDGKDKTRASVQGWWALGRLGSRVPFHGSAHNVVPAAVAAGWLGRVLALDWKKIQPAGFAATLLARLSGDRERDLDPELRQQVAQRLGAVRAPPAWQRLVLEVVALETDDQQRVFGEALPVGLSLLQD